MTTIHDLGVMLGRGMKREKPTAQVIDIGKKLTIPAPQVRAENKVNVTVDTRPIADAMRANLPEKRQDIDVLGAANVVSDAIKALEILDLAPLNDAIKAISAALTAQKAVDFGVLVKALDRNTAAIERQTSQMEAQTAALRADKSVEYDKQGRILRVKVG